MLLAVNVAIDVDTRFQQIEGFGTALSTYSGQTSPAYQNMYFQDMGSSIVRTSIDYRTLSTSHSATPTTAEMSTPIALGPDTYDNINLFNFGTVQASYAGAMAQAGAAQKLDDFKLIGSVWSPPFWMKGVEHNFWGGETNPPTMPSWQNFGNDNSGGSLIDTPDNMQQFGRYIAAYVKGFEHTYGVPYYAISIQNEPAFHQTYDSAVLDPDLMIKAIKAVKDAFNAHNADHPDDPILTKIQGPEDVGVGSTTDVWTLWRQMNYINAIRGDQTALADVDFYSVHGYANDGANPNRSPTMWGQYWNGRSFEDFPNPVGAWWNGIWNDGKESWMTETSGESANWSGALLLAENAQDALTQSNVNAWVYWQMTDTNPAGMFTLTYGSDTTTPKYNAAKHFFRYIRPGAVRVAATPSDPSGVYVSAYIQDTQHTLTSVLINTTGAPQTINMSAPASGVTGFNIARRSTSSTMWQDLGPINFVGGVATFTMPPQSIITLQGAASPLPTNIVAGKSNVAPVIDGNVDALWSGRTSYSINHLLLGDVFGSSDLSGTFKLAWDNNKLYLLADITDDTLINDSSFAWLDDSVELYLDGNLSRGTSYDGSNDVQLVFGYGDTAPSPGTNTAAFFGSGVQMATVATANGYRVEASVPWANLGFPAGPATGQRIGIDVHVNDDDDGGGRDGKLAFFATTDDSWHDPSTFAVAKLIADNSPPHALSAALDFATSPQKIKVTFDESVFTSLSDGDLTLVNLLNPDADVIPGAYTGYDSSTNTATFTFVNTIPDGYYKLQLLANGIWDSGHNTLDGNFTYKFFTGSGSLGSDDYRVHKSGSSMEVDGNGATFMVPLANLGAVALYPGNGDDRLTLDFSNGSPWGAANFLYDMGGQGAGDSMDIVGSQGDDTLVVSYGQVAFMNDFTPQVNIQFNQIEFLTFDASSGEDYMIVNEATPINLRFNGDADSNTLVLNAGTFNIDQDTAFNNQSLTINVNATANLVVNTSEHVDALNIVGGKVTISPGGGKALVMNSLSITRGGKLDLTNNGAILDYNGISPITTIRNWIITGRGQVGIGLATWTGLGSAITSSTAAADPDGIAVGYAENATLPLGSYSVFMGQQVDNSCILIKTTRASDADLDGVSNDNDVTIIGGNYLAPEANQWAFGDFDYDGVVNDNDVSILGGYYAPNAPVM